MNRIFNEIEQQIIKELRNIVKIADNLEKLIELRKILESQIYFFIRKIGKLEKNHG